MEPKDDATIIDTILNAADAPKKDSPEFRKKVTEVTNNLRQLLPELKEEPQQVIIDHLQASNRPVDGNGQYISNFVAYEDLMTTLLEPCRPRVNGKCSDNDYQ